MSQISERLLVQAHLDAKAPAPLSDAEKADYKARIAAALKAHNAVLVAHYYTDPLLQELAEETGLQRLCVEEHLGFCITHHNIQFCAVFLWNVVCWRMLPSLMP